MLAVYRTLSTRYLSRRWFRALLIVISISLGVATLVATQALTETMLTAGAEAVNPMAGMADLLVTDGETIDKQLLSKIRKVPGVEDARPRIFQNVRLPKKENRVVLLVGVDIKQEGSNDQGFWSIDMDKDVQLFDALRLFSAAQDFNVSPPAIVGKGLSEDVIKEGTFFDIVTPKQDAFTLKRLGILTAPEGSPASALAGNSVIVPIDTAAQLLQLEKNHVHRIDIVLEENADRDTVQASVITLLRQLLPNRSKNELKKMVRTPEEENEKVNNVFQGMHAGFNMCGMAALVVGLFLVYNALSVSVAERRHEIGVLLSVGATRSQVRLLFAGEAALLGLLGSILGIPLGIGLAYLGLEPAKDVVNDIFMSLDPQEIRLSVPVYIFALLAGIVTAVAATLIPAIRASNENPAEAVRRIPPKPTLHFWIVQISVSLIFMVMGTLLVLIRTMLPEKRVGTYGGIILLMLGTMLMAPLMASVLAYVLRPVFRLIMGIEMRLASDNLVRSPSRTGLVIAALAAGVSLVMQTAGIIGSNRQALKDWVEETITADLIVTSGSAVGAGGAPSLPKDLGKQLETIPGVERALPLRSKNDYRYLEKDVFINVLAIEAAELYKMEQKRGGSNALYDKLAKNEYSAIASENFLAKHRVRIGDTVSIGNKGKELAKLKIIGKVVDYSWNNGTLIVDGPTYRQWGDKQIDIFDLYLQPNLKPAEVESIRDTVLRKHGAENSLLVQTRSELQTYIVNIIDKLFSIAYAQLLVVMFVAALGVVTALLISVLQRQREIGLLRAIGASQVQVIRSVLAEAALMGFIGTLIGLAIGIPLEWYFLRVVMLEETGYQFAVHIPWNESLVIAATAMSLATLAGLGPALYAVKKSIPEAISYE